MVSPAGVEATGWGSPNYGPPDVVLWGTSAHPVAGFVDLSTVGSWLCTVGETRRPRHVTCVTTARKRGRYVWARSHWV